MAYFTAVEAAGGIPLGIPPLPERKLRVLYENCDALLLPGGMDLDPRSYGGGPGPEGEVHPELDRAELLLTRWARQDRVPLLGICRGAQMLNTALGGTLWRDLPTECGAVGHGGAEGEPTRHHELVVDPGSRLHGILGAGRLPANSRHHQAVRVAGDGLRVSARASDGTAEAIEAAGADADWFAVGVQWHPEELPPGHPASSQRLVTALLRAAQPVSALLRTG
ncbi:gamma-glutamyl-gamma-aminobutyrate hydrolase family protein [Streptomyces sp. NBC_00876]|uniref:gamma-glutamyl-gamma-aminobutyrate hydrolase family protein n=1 Tax=Streptomyces sp. NBC_00876 TaxID=2975853 RepID=UPI003869A106|nr:gamma-glutamyl-gamma-aminobutyrate hydrolase family protein [Streptomyces sp. NBC_00876]